jgi:hypothetical protein
MDVSTKQRHLDLQNKDCRNVRDAISIKEKEEQKSHVWIRCFENTSTKTEGEGRLVHGPAISVLH